MKSQIKASLITGFGNTFLFFLKIIFGLMFNSISLISDAFNSLLDIVSSIIIYFSIKISYKKPDFNHQFGHTRSQPIAGLIVAVFTSVFGFQIFLASSSRFFSNETLKLGIIPIFVMLIVIIVKSFYYIYTKIILKENKSLALDAACVDHRNDIFVSSVVLVGLILSNLGFVLFDSIAGCIVSIFIIASGINLAKENIKYLMGEAPSEEIFNKLESVATSVKGVIGVNDIRAHLLGSNIEAEVHIYVDKTLSLEKAHDIGNLVKRNLEKIDSISEVFIHIDPFKGKMISTRKF